MEFKIYVTRDFDHMSQVAANITIGKITDFISTDQKPYINFILPTGNSPTGMYKIIAEKQDTFDSSIVVSHNLDEYVGLPENTVTEREKHKESYARFMRENLFDKLKKPFYKYKVPGGCEVNQSKLEGELDKYKNNPEAYFYEGVLNGKKGVAITIPENSPSDYLKQIKKEVLDSYISSIRKNGKVDLTIVGVGGRGHIAFHESGIPLNLEMLLVKLDENTVQNAVTDGHFSSIEESPRYAVSMGAGFVFNPNYNSEVLLLAYGARKIGPLSEALLENVTSEVPISGCQEFAKYGKVIWIIDEIAAQGFLNKKTEEESLKNKGIQIVDIR